MKKRLYIITVSILILSAGITIAADSNSSSASGDGKREEISFESCGKDFGKGCKKENKKKFKPKKSQSVKPEPQK